MPGQNKMCMVYLQEVAIYINYMQVGKSFGVIV